MHWFWSVQVYLSSDSVIRCFSGRVFDTIYKTVSLHGNTDPAFIMDKFSLLQFLVTQNGYTLPMAFTDKLGPKPFHTVLSMHRLAGFPLSDFRNLITLPLRSTILKCTDEEINCFALALTLSKSPVSDSSPYKVEKAVNLYHSFGKVAMGPLPWILFAMGFFLFLPSACWELTFSVFSALSVRKHTLCHPFKVQYRFFSLFPP